MARDILVALIGFVGGIGAAIAGAIGTYVFQKRRDNQERRKRAAFKVYMLLLDLNARYWWVATKEFHHESVPPEIRAKVRDLAFRIADKLRESDDVKHLDDILKVLMNEQAYRSAADRAKAIEALLDVMGKTVNPRYAKSIQAASNANLQHLAERPLGYSNNAPGNLWP